jgi:molybdopterin-synthase adenylyltransferase
MQSIENEQKKYLEEQLLLLRTNRCITDLSIVNTVNEIAVKRGCVVTAEAKIAINEQTVSIHIGLNKNFPQSLPIILLSAGNTLGFIPHVEPDGFVCYLPNENLVLDSFAPEAILSDAIEKAIKVLKDGCSGMNKDEFVDEFDAYWIAYQHATPIRSFINPDENARKIVVALSNDKSNKLGYEYVSDNEATPIHFWHKSPGLVYQNGVYVPLLPGSFINLFDGRHLTAKEIRDVVLRNISPKNKKLLKKIVRKYKREEVVVIQIPRPSGGEVLFGVLFRGVHRDHPLNEYGQADQIVPLTLKRQDKAYLLPRGGANSLIQDKKVALIGCGAVGGHIAIQLVQSGILNLTLLDYDLLTPENIFRHVLGKDYLGRSKADALKTELENKFPYVDVKAWSLNIEEAFSKSIFDPNKFDLIILATGDDNLSLKINKLLYLQGTRTPILYSWLEPYGIGGHVLITNMGNKGCFQCLFTSLHQGGEFLNRAAFVAPGQSFTKDISGCANRFTPFSALDAGSTASLTARIALKILLGTVTGNVLFSWKGDSIDLLSAGFSVSDRYENVDVTTANKGLEVYSHLCPVCGEHRN